jgi:hypothetical protein
VLRPQVEDRQRRIDVAHHRPHRRHQRRGISGGAHREGRGAFEALIGRQVDRRRHVAAQVGVLGVTRDADHLDDVVGTGPAEGDAPPDRIGASELLPRERLVHDRRPSAAPSRSLPRKPRPRTIGSAIAAKKLGATPLVFTGGLTVRRGPGRTKDLFCRTRESSGTRE